MTILQIFTITVVIFSISNRLSFVNFAIAEVQIALIAIIMTI